MTELLSKFKVGNTAVIGLSTDDEDLNDLDTLGVDDTEVEEGPFVYNRGCGILYPV